MPTFITTLFLFVLRACEEVPCSLLADCARGCSVYGTDCAPLPPYPPDPDKLEFGREMLFVD